ncbi:MAG TPA: response regulator [Candidatus Marinimicrobia bacterium]|nr:response regulator [Candidatus Neomarinimicrobiota bacterium]
MKILLIEDNELNLDMLTRRLERKGFTVISAEDGLSGIEKANQEKPKLIIMDLSLPILDGWDAAKKLKAEIATKSIPIIALTAHAMKGDRQKALNAGCDEYDTKPVDLDRLLGKIGKVTGT